jgi:hypothetical protein
MWCIEKTFYGDEELLMHKKIWNILNLDKEGRRRERSFVNWCIRIAGHRLDGFGANSAATEHANDDNRFRRLAEDIFAHDLTAEQTKDPKYHLREGKSITTKQRSFINTILRENLGDARVAYYIFEYGIPTMLDSPVLRRTLERSRVPLQVPLQDLLEELMRWYASLLKWLVEHRKDPKTIMAQKLSDLDQKPWQAERRRQKAETQEQLRHGRKRFHEMSATEQRDLEDFECGRSKKRHDELRIRRPRIRVSDL